MLPAPERNATLFRRYLEVRSKTLEARDDRENPYLFPARYRGRALSSAAIASHPKKYKLNTKVLRGTALLSFFQNSDAAPNMAVACFGVDLSTALRYFKLAESEIRADMRTYVAFERPIGGADGLPEE